MSGTTILPSNRVTIVGVLNATPDSFSDGGRFVDADASLHLERAVTEAEAMVAAGAHWVDVGGESTRPGAEPVSADEEIRRTRPIVEALAKALEVPISIDTRKSAVAEAALDAGASIVNDVTGLEDPALAALVAKRNAGLVIGHLRGELRTMQKDVAFEDVVLEVGDELAAIAQKARAAGIPSERLAVDPGIGFGKNLEHNLALLARVDEIRDRVGLPVLIGPSRKSFLGALTGLPASERDLATHVACAVGVFAGAGAIRVHDVPGAVQAMAVAAALHGAKKPMNHGEGSA